VAGCSAAKPCPPGKKCNASGQCEEDGCTLAKIYYDFNRAFIRTDAKDTLKANIDCINKMTAKKVLVTGHCDERGTTEFNIRLGERRADAARNYLKKLGIAADRFCKVVSKGKDEPVVSNATTEEQHQQNRRAVFDLLDSCP
jgi:peptidoglycan-associated lipoprotein